MLNFCIRFFVIIFIASCAQVVAPNGGPKDITPPSVIEEKPLNKSINFSTSVIALKFNEFININNPQQIVISPPIEPKPEIDFNGKEITVKFKDTLKANTTYTINFANAVSDITENNALNNYTYVFSTGSVLDSNRVMGNVTNAFNNKAEKDFTVALYHKNTFTDTTALKHLPAYFAKTNASGEFIIDNLPADSFYVLTFLDLNNNLKYDITENTGFILNTINTTAANDKYLLKSFKPDLYNNNYIKDSFNTAAGVFVFTIYKPKDFTIEPLLNKAFYSKQLTGKDEFDSLYFYIPVAANQLYETFKIINKLKDTTFLINLSTRKNTRLTNIKLDAKTISFPDDTLVLTTNNPIKTLKTDNIHLFIDSTQLSTFYVKQTNPFNIQVYTPWIQQKQYTLLINDSAIKDCFNQYYKSFKTSFTIPDEKAFGSLTLTLLNKQKRNLILQLVTGDEAETIINKQTIKNDKTLFFKYLNPNIIKLKVIEDINNNGVWDTGNLKHKILPEPVYYHTETITIRAYWDLEQTIDLDVLK